ncbi:hypothetical protein Alches_04280 [Alicyclobacillus hesperidum subsp. aegles]|nr:hypothetical protein Alches_04280 [Alicyclobacillus hesperidum subsp. aegles]
MHDCAAKIPSKASAEPAKAPSQPSRQHRLPPVIEGRMVILVGRICAAIADTFDGWSGRLES